MNQPVEVKIHLNKFKPRDYQRPIFKAFFEDRYRRMVIVMCRRAGKDLCTWNIVIREAISRPGVYYVVYPTYSQGKKILWSSVTIQGERFLDYIPKQLIEGTNSQEMKVVLTNGSIIQIIGSDNPDRIVGTNPRGVVFSEYALQNPRIFALMSPILAANKGWAIFQSTPRGKNHFWDLYQIGLNSPEWWTCKLGLNDTRHIDPAEIDREIEEGLMSPDLVQQEYYCFDKNQKVLAYDGMTSIANVKKDDLVLSHAGRWRRVSKTISRDYSGKVVRIKSFGSCEDIVCTPNHRLRTYDYKTQSYDWREASSVTTDDYLAFPKATLGSVQVIRRELALLMAWYITEGSSFKNALQFTMGSDDDIETVCGLLDDLNIKHSIIKAYTATLVAVYSTPLTDFMRANCGVISYYKRIPFTLIAGHEEEFFFELIKGDGCKYIVHDREYMTYSTVSRTLAYQVQLLANSLNIGLAGGITSRPAYVGFIEGRQVNCKKSYSVQITPLSLRGQSKNLRRAKNCIAGRVKEVEESDYSGKVYNLSVQYDESYTVGGRAVHNCSFEAGVEGSFYCKYVDRMRLNNQIGVVPWESGFQVHTAWDLGVRDSTIIIFFQIIGQVVRIIDYYEKAKEGLEHYANHVLSKPYTYGKHIAPHDIKVKELGSGMTRIEKARKLGIRFTVATNVSIMDGIESVRSALSKIWIDEIRCAKLIRALENYRQEYDSKRQVYKDVPLHDIYSHACDSMRYLCVTLPKTRDSITAEELERMRYKAMHGDESDFPGFFSSKTKMF